MENLVDRTTHLMLTVAVANLTPKNEATDCTDLSTLMLDDIHIPHIRMGSATMKRSKMKAVLLLVWRPQKTCRDVLACDVEARRVLKDEVDAQAARTHRKLTTFR